MAGSVSVGDRLPGLWWSDAYGWYVPVCVPVLVYDRYSTSGQRLEYAPVTPPSPESGK